MHIREIKKAGIMKFYLFPLLLIIISLGSAHADSESLSAAINSASSACASISEDMSDIKTMASINTVITGVGTMSGGIGVAVGISKTKTDEELVELKAKLAAIDEKNGNIEPVIFDPSIDTTNIANGLKPQDLEDKSKKAGNIRTGMFATNTAGNIAGTVISAANKPGEDLKLKIQACLDSVGKLQSEKMQARLDGIDDTDSQMQIAQNIIDNCSKYNPSDLDSIINQSTGSIIAGTIGIATGGAGTATSIAANRDSIRSDNSEEGIKKENNLNTASNVLGAAGTGASAVMTIFNAAQISSAKKIMNTADTCEGAFK